MADSKSRRICSLVASASIIALMSASPSFADAEFFGIPSVGESVLSSAQGVSGDGSVVVGVSQDGSSLGGFYWTAETGTVLLEGLSESTFFTRATSVSGDGSIIVGTSQDFDNFGGSSIAVRWINGGSPIALGEFPGGGVATSARDISVDGTVIVGWGGSERLEAFRWTESGGVVGLGFLTGGDSFSYAMATNGDGSVIVGYSVADTISFIEYEAWRWTESEGMVGLGNLPGFEETSLAADVSADGRVVVGYVGTDDFTTLQAFRWTAGEGMVGLGDLEGGDLFSIAVAANTTGSVIVGYGTDEAGIHAVRWLTGIGEASGPETIADLLTEEGVDLGEWQLDIAYDVSSDGSVIVGYGQNPDGAQQAWRAVLGIGLVSIEEFYTTLASTGGTVYAAQGMVRRDAEGIMNVARHFNGRQGGGQAAADIKGINLWGLIGHQSSSTSYGDGDAPSGAFGAWSQVRDDLRVGFGARLGEAEFELAEDAGESTRTSWGLGAYAAYEPPASPLRIYAGVVASWSENDLMRNYVNGVEPVMSSGQRNGTSYGGTIQFGWEHGVSERASIMPFASFEITKVELDAFTETGGPFPARFDKIDEAVEIGRLGVEVSYNLDDGAVLWGSAAWAHQFDDELPGITGSVAEFGSDFAFAGAMLEQDRAEFRFGLDVNVNDQVRLNTSINVASDFDSNPAFGLTLGFTMKL